MNKLQSLAMAITGVALRDAVRAFSPSDMQRRECLCLEGPLCIARLSPLLGHPPGSPGRATKQGSCATAGLPWGASDFSHDVFWSARAVPSPRRRHNCWHLQPGHITSANPLAFTLRLPVGTGCGSVQVLSTRVTAAS